jgi:hypothetical protein
MLPRILPRGSFLQSASALDAIHRLAYGFARG